VRRNWRRIDGPGFGEAEFGTGLMGQDLVKRNWHRIDVPGFGEAELAQD
jgi:hypothetical protein